MTHIRWIQSAALALTLTLSITSLVPALAVSGASAPIRAAVGKVNITASSYMELKQINLLPDQIGKLAAFTITIHNQGSSELLFIDYWVRLKSTSGNKFSTRLLPADKDKNQVTPGSSMDITFYAKVNDTTALQDLIVQFIKWDFNQPGFESVIGEVAVPSTYTNVTPADEAYLMRIGGTDVAASIKKLVSNKNEKYYVPTVYLTLENVGSNSVTMPAYLFSILTSEGLLYPLEAKGVKDLIINPKESKEIQLSGTIPVSVSADNWQLMITENLTDLKLKLPIASFALPKVSLQEEGSIGKEYTFTSKSGVYTAKMNGLYRLPWEDQDILTADLTLLNKGTDSLPIPDLTGYFMLDNAVKVEAKLVKTAKVIALGTNSNVSFQIAGKIPYTYEFSQVKLVLQEKETAGSTTGGSTGGSTGTVTDVLEFTGQSELQAIPLQKQTESYTLTDIGRQSKFTVRSTASYSGKTGKLFTVQLEAANLEKRFSTIAKLVAHFRAENGTIFPAAIAEVKNKVSPSGKAILNVSATLPLSYSTSNMQLLIGEAVTDGMLTEGDKAVADSYVKPAAFVLPEEDKTVKDKLKDVQLFPYTISMNKIGTTIENSKVTLIFDYEITKDALTETNLEGRKLIISLDDSKGIKSFERAFDLKSLEPAASDATTDLTNTLQLGKHEKFKISVTDADLIYKLEFLKKYNVSVYEEFQGQRKLLASQANDWFTISD
jgi:hypothetical protein